MGLTTMAPAHRLEPIESDDKVLEVCEALAAAICSLHNLVSSLSDDGMQMMAWVDMIKTRLLD